MIQIYLARYEADHEKGNWKREHELGQKLLSIGLKDLYGICPEAYKELVILKGEHGKPYLKDFPHIHYNISHTDGMVACGIGDKELGIDVERIRPFRHNILRKVFSDAERCRMEQIPEEEHCRYFFQIWTLKESYVKAVGCGITFPLPNVSFEWREGASPVCSIPGTSFQQTLLEGGYVLSVCTLGEEEMKLCKNIDYKF